MQPRGKNCPRDQGHGAKNKTISLPIKYKILTFNFNKKIDLILHYIICNTIDWISI
jgi:hypothetical protein